MKKLLSLLAFVFFIFALSGQNYVRISIPNFKDNYQKIIQTPLPFDDGYLKKDGSLILEISQSDLKYLEAQNIDYQILIDDLKNYYKKRIANSVPYYPKDTPENFNLGSMGGNLTFDEMVDELNEMHQLFPDLITAPTAISDTFSHNGYPIYYVKISDNASADEDEPEVLFTGLHHAREPVSMMQLIYLMWWLLENYGTDEEATYFVDNFEIYFVPCVNPDGYKYNEQTDPNGGGMWRKNRRDNGNGDYGVDLNRNYSFNWGYDDSGSSPDPSSDTYRGPSPASEPETQNMISFIEKHNFKLILNHHTYSNLLIYPYGYDEVYPEDYDVFHTYALIMTRVNNFEIGTPWELLYPVNGDANDWAYGEHKILAMTPETGGYEDGFWPSQDRIIPLCENNMEMNKFLIRLTGAYAEAYDANNANMPIYGFFKYQINFLGQDTTAIFKVYLTGDDVLYSDTAYYSNYSILTNKIDSLEYLLDTNLVQGDSANIFLAIDNGKITYKKQFGKKIIFNQIIYQNSGNLDNWTTDAWGITTEDYYSAPYSITDSPNGDYQNDTYNNLTSPVFDLSGYENLLLSFKAKWDIESGYDFVHLRYFTQNDTANLKDYTGSSEWTTETFEIPNANIYFKFTLESDYSITKDGFYFDDFTISASKENQPPTIVNQNYTFTPQVNQEVEIPLDIIDVEDPDSEYPNGFAIIVLPGEGYEITKFNTIKITSAKSNLLIPIKTTDGYNLSNIWYLNAEPTNVENNSFAVKIFPNPFDNQINITSDENIEQITIYSLDGKKVKNIGSVNAKKYQFSTKDLQSGLYILEVKTAKNIIQKTVVKK